MLNNPELKFINDSTTSFVASQYLTLGSLAVNWPATT